MHHHKGSQFTETAFSCIASPPKTLMQFLSPYSFALETEETSTKQPCQMVMPIFTKYHFTDYGGGCGLLQNGISYPAELITLCDFSFFAT